MTAILDRDGTLVTRYGGGYGAFEAKSFSSREEIGIVEDIDEDGEVVIRSFIANSSIKNPIPRNMNVGSGVLKGEYVLCNTYTLKNGFSVTLYEPLPLSKSLTSNTSVNYNRIKEKDETTKNSKINLDKIDGIPSTLDNKKKLNKYFYGNNSYDKKLLSFEGDYIFQGRSGQTIRFGSSIPSSVDLGISDTNFFGKAKSEKSGGNPYIIISSGKSNLGGKYLMEDIQNDPATIVLSNGGESGMNFSFLLSSQASKTIQMPTSFNDNFILFNSDRLIFNSKASDIFISSFNDISVSANNVISIRSKNNLELFGAKVFLGENATDTVVLSDELKSFLSRLIDAILNLRYCKDGSQTMFMTDMMLKFLKNELNGNVSFKSKTIFCSS